METSLQNLLADGLGKIDNSLVNNEIIKRLSCLYDQISLFNPSYGLVNASGDELVIKHILDCVAPAPIIRCKIHDEMTIADLGSGSGLPGLVLASVFEKNSFVLVERMGRRCQFLDNAIVLLGLKDRVRVLKCNLSEVKEKFDFITFRAFRPVSDIAKDLDRITNPNSSICIFKSSEENIKDEISAIEKYSSGLFSSEVIPYGLPFSNASRNLLFMKKNQF